MVFHEIDSITDVISGHRIIIYYIEGKLSSVCTKRNDTKYLETVMEMLEKKNDDLLIIKVLHGSLQFDQFQEIYKAEVTGAVTLFVVNNEGIPLMCEQMNLAENVPDIIKTLCATCKLNSVSLEDIKNISQTKAEPILTTSSSSTTTGSRLTFNKLIPEEPADKNNESDQQRINNEDLNETQHRSTRLQIRLPNGQRVQQQFDKDAMLEEVWVFISVKYKLKNFYLKTYNHQVFSEDEFQKTLQSLDLYPSGVIIVVEKNILPSNVGGIGVMIHNGFNQIMGKTTSLFHYIQGLLFMLWQSFFSSNSSGDRRDQERRPRITPEGSTGRTASTKKFGNIHTLKRSDDSDDENNRYNGNSTQQK